MRPAPTVTGADILAARGLPEGSLREGGRVVVPRVWLARGVWSRMRGLLGCPDLPDGCGLLLDPCGSVHTFGMRFAIDLAFLDRHGRVCRVVRDVSPGRGPIFGGWTARRTLEVASGQLEELRPGTMLKWTPADEIP